MEIISEIIRSIFIVIVVCLFFATLSRLKKDIDEEKADVFIMAYQHYLMSPQVQKLVDEKIKRTLDRIASGYYGVS